MKVGGLAAVVPYELEAGFRLAGVETVCAHTEDEAAASLRQLLSKGERAMIAIYEPFLAGLPDSERISIETSLDPVIVLLPAGLEQQEGQRQRARISEMLSRAVGYHITFGEGPQ